MRFYNKQHQFYAGIDLHARSMFVCIINSDGTIVLHKNMDADRTHPHHAIEPFIQDIVIDVECVFTWYWIADFCDEYRVPFILGHALYMKAIHGGKTKNDKIDSSKIASLIRGGMFPMAYVYPKESLPVPDLLRRRQYFVHHPSELLGHIQNTNTQYNLPPFEKKIAHQANRAQLDSHFAQHQFAQISIDADRRLLDFYHRIILDLEQAIKKHAVHHNEFEYHLLRSVPGIGPILALVILYEIHDIRRFSSVGNFISYSRLVKCPYESAGKRVKGGHNKIGNSHLKWAFSEAAVLFLRNNPPAKKLQQRLISRYGKAKALSLIAQKLGRTVYYMLKRKEPFAPMRFFKDSVHAPVA